MCAMDRQDLAAAQTAFGMNMDSPPRSWWRRTRRRSASCCSATTSGSGPRVDVHVVCGGGRHRFAVAEEIALYLRAAGIGCEVEHRHRLDGSR
jgi:hypothetical protein